MRANSGRQCRCREIDNTWSKYSAGHIKGCPLAEPEPISGEASPPLCTLTGHECGSDTVMKGHTCPDERNHFHCPKVDWSAGKASPLYSEQEMKEQGLQASTIHYGAEGSATMYSSRFSPEVDHSRGDGGDDCTRVRGASTEEQPPLIYRLPGDIQDRIKTSTLLARSVSGTVSLCSEHKEPQPVCPTCNVAARGTEESAGLLKPIIEELSQLMFDVQRLHPDNVQKRIKEICEKLDKAAAPSLTPRPDVK